MQTKARSLYQRKILDLPGLLSQREAARAGGKLVVHCHGCFDIVHPGHIRYLQFAKQQGDVLIVSLTGDPHVGKGEGRPYVPEELRAENLAALEFVDWVYINPTQTAVDLLGKLKPDIYLKGREYEYNNHPGFVKEKTTVEAYGGRVMFSSGNIVYSSTQIIENYASRLDLEQEKLSLFCQRYEIGRGSLLSALDEVVDRPFVVIGDMNVDRYQYCDATDIAPDAPMMSLVPLESRDYMGGAAMIARHLAGLGAEPTLIASFGRDAASDEAIDSLESLGVHVLPLRNRKKIALRTRFVADGQKVFLLDESQVNPTDSASEKWINEEVQRLATPESTMVVYDAGLGIFSDRMTFDLIRGGHHGYAKVVAGTAGSRGRLVRLAWADMLVATERGLRVAMRDYEQGISSLACRMLDDLHAKALLMPSGRKGLFCFDVHPNAAEAVGWEGKLRSEYLSNQANGSIDKLGCQEALLAVAAAMLGSGANIHQAAYVALAASIIESRQPGHQAMDGHELRQMLEQSLPE